MSFATATTERSLPLDRDRVPRLLKDRKCWVVWRAGRTKPSGKFDKVPVDPTSGRNIKGNDPANWMTFEDACAAYDRGACSGIGIALCAEPATHVDGQPLYLVALDFDHCDDRVAEIEALWKTLGRPYAEVSPSRKGIRMLALSRSVIKGGNAGGGREMYGAGRFVTVTGIEGRGDLIDATEKLLQLEAEWFPKKAAVPPARPGMLDHLLSMPLPETQANIDKVKAQLASVSADCSYEKWIRIVWSVRSTGWDSALEIARTWSMTAPHRYDEPAFLDVWTRFDPTRGITLGTLDHHARAGEWQPEEQRAEVAALEIIEQAKTRSKLLRWADLNALPPHSWRVRHVLPTRGLAAIYGPSMSGKTFLALDLACAVAAGSAHWFGARATKAPVVYVALEGEAGIKRRLAAWKVENTQEVPDALRIKLGDFTLLREDDAKTLAVDVLKELGTGAVVFIDTLNSAAPGADENSSADMGRIIKHAKTLANDTAGLVVLIHHTGKDASRGMRGHSSLFAAMDAVIEVSAAPTGRSWRLGKPKEAEAGAAHGFELVSHAVGQDEFGMDASSCAVRRSLPRAMVAAAPTKPIVGKHQKTAHEVLDGLLAGCPEGMDEAAAVVAVAARLNCPQDRQQARARDAIERLAEAGHLLRTDKGALVLPSASGAPESLRFPFSIEKTGKAVTGSSRNGTVPGFRGPAPHLPTPAATAETFRV